MSHVGRATADRAVNLDPVETDMQIRRPGRASSAVVLAVGMVVSAATVWQASQAAFTATTANPGNSFSTGTVVLNDKDGGGTPMTGTAIFNVGALEPGDSITRCLNVTYSGSAVTTPIRFYTTTTTDPTVGGGPQTLGTYLTVVVEEGTGATDTACTGYSSAGATTVFDTTHRSGTAATAARPAGSMADLTGNNTSYASGLTGAWTPAPASPSRSYRFTVGLPGTGSDTTDNTLQNRTLITTFTWETQT
jgi:hypothetical protein